MMKVVRPLVSRLMPSITKRLGLDIERRGRLVQHQDRRFAQNGAGDGEPLLFAFRKIDGFAEHGVIALGQRDDEVVDARELGRRLDFLVAAPGRP